MNNPMEITVFKDVRSCICLPKRKIIIMCKRIEVSFHIKIHIRLDININYTMESLIRINVGALPCTFASFAMFFLV